jgi:hypothetical protein
MKNNENRNPLANNDVQFNPNESLISEKEKQPNPKKLKLKFILPLLTVGLLILLLVLFIFVLGNNKNQSDLAQSSLTPTPEAQALTPTPTKNPHQVITKLLVPKHDGKITFVKNGDVYVSNGDGVATAITKNGLNEYPKWSPDGKYLTFIDNETGFLMFYDGKNLKNLGDVEKTYLPSWIGDNVFKFISIPKSDKFDAKGHTSQSMAYYLFDPLKGIPAKESGIIDVFYVQCGGGGNAEYTNTLSKDIEGGYMTGVRRNAIYLQEKNKVVLDDGVCSGNKVYSLAEYNNSSLAYNGSKDFRSLTDAAAVPAELLLSPDNKSLVGTLSKGIALYDLDGNLTKTLDSSDKAHAPVFSKDGNSVYYANDYTTSNQIGTPDLEMVSVNVGVPKTLYKSSLPAEIGSIAPSVNGNKVLFTLIEQTVPYGDKEFAYGNSKASLMMYDSTTGLTSTFEDDAIQPDFWSK